MYKDHLALATLVTPSLEYSVDEDGNLALYQASSTMLLTPTQQQALLSLLEVNLDLIRMNYLRGLK